MAFKRIGTVDEQGVLQPKDAFLPNLEAVEGRISERTDLLSEGIEEFKRPVEGNVLERFGTTQIESLSAGLKTIGGVFQRGEASIANVLLNLQRGDVETSLVDEFTSGLKGEKLGQLGDAFRAADVGGSISLGNLKLTADTELIAKLGGFFSAAGLANIASGGLLKSGAAKMQNAISKGVKRGRVRQIRKSTRFFKDQADQFSEGIDDAFSGMRGEYQKVYSKIGDNAIIGEDLINLQDVVVRQPASVINKVKRLSDVKGRPRLFADKTRTVLKSNINSAKTFQREIGRSIPKRVWSKLETPTEIQLQMMDDYFSLGEIIAKNAGSQKGELLRLNAKMSELHKLTKKITPILKKSRGTTSTSIRKIKTEEMQGDLVELQRFNKRFFKEGEEILRTIDKYQKGQRIKKGIGIGLATLGGGALLNQFVRKPITRALSDAGGGGGSSQSQQ